MKSRSLGLSTENQNVLLMATYPVDYSALERIGKTDDSPDKIAHGATLETTLEAETGYVLPPAIIVTRTDEDGTITTLQPVTADNPDGDYTYDQKTDKVSVKADAVTGKISLSGEAIQSFNAEYECTLYAIETNQAAAYTQTVTVKLTDLVDHTTETKVLLLMLAGKTFKVTTLLQRRVRARLSGSGINPQSTR